MLVFGRAHGGFAMPHDWNVFIVDPTSKRVGPLADRPDVHVGTREDLTDYIINIPGWPPIGTMLDTTDVESAVRDLRSVVEQTVTANGRPVLLTTPTDDAFDQGRVAEAAELLGVHVVLNIEPYRST